MAEDHHTDDLLNVNEGDRLEIVTTTGTELAVDCMSRETQQADPRSGEVRETEIWEFQAIGLDGAVTLYASILNGLKSSKSDPDFPQHSQLFNATAEVNLGYIDTVAIEGPRLE